MLRCPIGRTCSELCSHSLARDSLEPTALSSPAQCMSLLLPEDLLCLVPPISGFSIFKGRAQMANGGQVILSPRGKNLSLANPEKELEGHQGLSCHSLGLAAHGIFFPIPPSRELGSYFIIWSGTGLFLNLGCSSKTGWTVKHWMSGIPAVKAHIPCCRPQGQFQI